MKLAVAILVALLLVLIGILELVLRSRFGFGNPLLYIPDREIGYLLAPNQSVRRFGNRIEVNQYSMRSGAVTPTPAPGVQRVLLLGDSVANGGWWTDQTDTISSLMAHHLGVEVLNASANSWGPRNELAYLKRFGGFGARVIVLLLNTDDLFATAPTTLVVGRDRNYPNHKPPLALVEVITRFLPPPPPSEALKAVMAESGDRGKVNLEAIREMVNLSRQQGSELILAMTPLKRELGQPGPKDYELKARQRLKEFTQETQIPYIDFLPRFNTHDQVASLYQDHIHLNQAGNGFVSHAIGQVVSKLLTSQDLI